MCKVGGAVQRVHTPQVVAVHIACTHATMQGLSCTTVPGGYIIGLASLPQQSLRTPQAMSC
jgi:hypothetical protein